MRIQQPRVPIEAPRSSSAQHGTLDAADEYARGQQRQRGVPPQASAATLVAPDLPILSPSAQRSPLIRPPRAF